MHIHVLAGCDNLLRPNLIDMSKLAERVGKRVRPATTLWLSPRTGAVYHEILRESPADARVKVFATSLGENFGSRFAPLIVLPGLLDEAVREAHAEAQDRRTALDVVDEIRRRCAPERMSIHALALPDPEGAGEAWLSPYGVGRSETEAKLDRLREACRARGAPDEGLSCAAIVAAGEGAESAAIMRNVVAQELAGRIVARAVREAGVRPDRDVVAVAAYHVLARWSEASLWPTPPLDEARLDALARNVLDVVLARSGKPKSGLAPKVEKFARAYREIRMSGGAD